MKFVLGLFTKDLHLKFLAFCMAILAWIYLQEDLIIEQDLEIPVEWKFPEALLPVEQPPDHVMVRIKGRRGAVFRADRAQMKALLDYSQSAPGTKVIELSAGLLENKPSNVEIRSFQPSTLELRLDPLASRDVPVRVVTKDKPGDGYALASTTTSPKSVKVTGPASRIKAMRYVDTSALSLEERVLSGEVELLLKKDPYICVLEPDRVVVSFNIASNTDHRFIRNVPLRVFENQGKLDVDRIKVTLTGPSNLISGVNKENLVAMVHLHDEELPTVAKFNAETGAVIRLIYPHMDQIQVDSIEPSSVTIHR